MKIKVICSLFTSVLVLNSYDGNDFGHRAINTLEALTLERPVAHADHDLCYAHAARVIAGLVEEALLPPVTDRSQAVAPYTTREDSEFKHT